MSILSKTVFYMAFGIDCLAVLLAIYFVIEDATRFAGYPKNGGNYLIIGTVILCAWVAGSYYLFNHGPKALAIVMAWIPALPVLLYGIFVGMFIVLKPDFK